MPITKVNDINIYYEVRGNGEPIVIIVGLGSDISLGRPIIDELSKKYKVIAFDNRGAGQTDKPDEPYSIDLMAEDTLGLMDKLKIKKATVMGISMGGRIALALTLNHPDRIKRLILVSTSASRRTKIKMSVPMRIVYPLKWLPLFTPGRRQPRYAFLRQRTATLDYDVISRLKEVKAPTLILHGKKDVTIPFEHAVALKHGIKDSKLIPFKGGHLFFILKEHTKLLDEIAYFVD